MDYMEEIMEVTAEIKEMIKNAERKPVMDDSVNELELAFLVRQAVAITRARLEAGHHPESILLSLWDLFEHPVRALIDGRYESAEPMIALKAHKAEMQDAEERIRAYVDYALGARGYIGDLEEACAPSKLKKLHENWECINGHYMRRREGKS
jgi:hypothetical protein